MKSYEDYIFCGKEVILHLVHVNEKKLVICRKI